MTEKQTEALEKLNRGIQESKQEVQQQTIDLAQDYFGDSAEALKQQVRENRAALEGLPDQIPGGREEAFQTPFQALMDNFTHIEECLEEARKNVAELDKEQLRKQGEVEASDAARRQAWELGIDLTEIEGTGADGRIVVDDVKNAAEAAGNGAAQQTQDAAGEATQQVGQAAQGTQNVGGQATQQASQVADQTGGAVQQAQDAAGAAEETVAPMDASDAAKREAEARGIDLSKIEGTGADGRIVYWDVAEPADEAEGGADPAEQLKNQAGDAAGQAAQGAQDTAGQAAGQATDQAGQVAGQAQEAAGQATEQAGQVAGQAQETAGGAAQQAQDAVGQATQQASGALGGVTDQVGQAAGQVQEAAGGAAQQAQNTAGQATEQAQSAAGQATQQAGQAAGGDGSEEPRVTKAARRKAEEMGVDLSTVEGTGSGGLITLKDVTGS